MTVTKNILILVVAAFLAHFTAEYSGKLLFEIIQMRTGLFSLTEDAIIYFTGLINGYVFLITIFYTLFGGGKKYWWMGIALIPALAFELYFDRSHIFVPVISGLAGWLIGVGLRKLYALSTK